MESKPAPKRSIVVTSSGQEWTAADVVARDIIAFERHWKISGARFQDEPFIEWVAWVCHHKLAEANTAELPPWEEFIDKIESCHVTGDDVGLEAEEDDDSGEAGGAAPSPMRSRSSRSKAESRQAS